jgi:hypothetical protein
MDADKHGCPVRSFLQKLEQNVFNQPSRMSGTSKPQRTQKNQWLASFVLFAFALFAFLADKQAGYHLCSSAFICGLSFLLMSFDKNS